MLFGHGLGKLERLLEGGEIKFMNFLGLGTKFSLTLAVSAEFFAAALVALGLFTRIGSFMLITTMSVAAFIAHADDPFSTQEKALLFLASYILLFLTGPGKYSLNGLLEKKMNRLNNFWKFVSD
ncbi:MAG: DoxX family protein [Melioribacteraceae bacterium]|nr:DoxX family protein [Melioribacteraceae bacterium]